MAQRLGIARRTVSNVVTTAGLRRHTPVCASTHDDIFAVAPAEKEKETVEGLLSCMRRASIDVIGVEVPVEVEIIRYPDRYVPEKPEAVATWKVMMNAPERIEAN